MQSASKDYEDRIVLFLDILGFSELVEEIDSNPTTIDQLIEIFSRMTLAFGGVSDADRKRTGLQFSNFSDCILVSALLTKDNLLHIIRSAQIFAAALLGTGYLTRGAISVGKLYHRRNALFGRALVEAYKLESRVAKYPRILLSPGVMLFTENRLKQDVAPTDVDGLRYVNIFQKDFFEGHKEHFKPGFSYVGMMKIISDVLKLKASEFSSLDPSSLEKKSKVIWLINAFNMIATQHEETKQMVIK